MGITHSSVLGKINSAGKVILGKSYTSPYDWEMTNFHARHKEAAFTQVQSVSLVGLD